MPARCLRLTLLLTGLMPVIGHAADAPVPVPVLPVVDPQAVSASFGFRGLTDGV